MPFTRPTREINCVPVRHFSPYGTTIQDTDALTYDITDPNEQNFDVDIWLSLT
jgi:hypothetical protein